MVTPLLSQSVHQKSFSKNENMHTQKTLHKKSLMQYKI